MKWEKLINLHFSLKLILTKGDNNSNNCTYKVSIIIIVLRKLGSPHHSNIGGSRGLMVRELDL